MTVKTYRTEVAEAPLHDIEIKRRVLLPPMSHAAFKKAWITWLATGAYAPSK